MTNGEIDGLRATSTHGTLAWTPELDEGCTGCGFVFPDDEALVQAEFQKQLPRSRDVAKSAVDPAHPVSHLGHQTKPLYLKSDDTTRRACRSPTSSSPYSYGDPQEVRVIAMRALGDVIVKYRINGGAIQTAPTTEWTGGERYGGEAEVYYHVDERRVTGTNAGDTRARCGSREGGATSDSFTYQAVRVDEPQGARRRRRGLHGRLARADRRGRTTCPTTRTRSPRTASRRRLRRRRARPQGAGRPRRAHPLQGRHLVHGRRHRHP